MKRHIWTKDETRSLERDYPVTSTHMIAKRMNISVHHVYNKAFRLGLKKDDSYLKSPLSGRLVDGANIGGHSRFRKGDVPWNKGLKGVCFGGKETQLKPGNRSGKAVDLYLRIGSERLSKEGYLERKINDDLPFKKRWKAVHILLWEQENGDVQKGSVVVFKDGNKKNIAIENLELISRSELMRRNSYHRYGEEIARLYQLKGAIKRQINKRASS